jgi:hypothetical protein
VLLPEVLRAHRKPHDQRMPEGRPGSAEERRREAERQLAVQMAVEAALGAIGTKYSAEDAAASRVVDISAGRGGS